MEMFRVVLEQLERALVAGLRDRAHLVVDGDRGLLAVVLVRGDLLAEENHLLLLAEGERAEPLAHAELAHHPSSQAGRAFEVVGGSGGEVVEHQLLGGSASHHHRDRADQVVPGPRVPLLRREVGGDAQGAAARDDRDLVHRIGARHQPGHQRVARLVVGGVAAFLLGHHQALAFHAEHDLVLGVLEILHGDLLAIAAGREQRRLVHHVRQVRSRQAGGGAGDLGQVHVFGDRDVAAMDAEDPLAAAHIGPIHHDLPVESAGPQQRGIEHVGPIGGGDDDHALVGVEAVHLHQQLVQGLLALVVSASQACAAVTSHRVDLVDEHDARRVALALLEQVTDPARAHAHEHLDEIRAAHREERDAGLARDRLGKQGLAGARRAQQQGALGNAAAEALEFLRLLEELDDLLQLLLGLVAAGHVLEGDLGGALDQHLRLGLAELEGRAPAALHLAHQQQPEGQEEQDRQRGEHERDPVEARRTHFDLDPGIGLPHPVRQIGAVAENVGAERLETRFRLGRTHRLLVLELAGDHALDDLNVGDVAVLDLGDEAGVGDLDARRGHEVALVHAVGDQSQKPHEHPERELAERPCRRRRRRASGQRSPRPGAATLARIRSGVLTEELHESHASSITPT